MFCDFYYSSKYCFEEQKQNIINEIYQQPKIRIYDSLDEIQLRNSQIENVVIIFDAFSFELSELEEYQSFKRKDYNINFDFHVHLEIYNDVEDWDKEMMVLLNYLLGEIVNDCVLEYYGNPVMVRRAGKIEIDESKTGRLVGLPFDLLNKI